MVLAALREKLAKQIADGRIELSLRKPLIEIHLASSMLQKALRRGDREPAISAALALAYQDPGRLWRRLSAIVCEDFGLVDLGLTGKVVAAASDAEWRHKVGGDAVVAICVVQDMLLHPRDRQADELLMWGSWAHQRSASCAGTANLDVSAPLEELLQLSIRVILRCERPHNHSRHVHHGPRHCDLALATMRGRGWIDDQVYTILLQARRTSKTILPVILGLIASRAGVAPTKERVTIAPRTEVVAGIPLYCLDGFTRPGQDALWRLVRVSRDLRNLIAGKRADKAMRALTALLFEVEGGCLTREAYTPLSDELRIVSRGCWSGLDRRAFDEGVKILRPLLPELNSIRHSVLGGS